MAFSGYEDQRLPRELDDYEHEQVFGSQYDEACDICGDGIYWRRAITINDKRCCGSECACVVLDELLCDEMASPVPEELPEDEDTTPLPSESMTDVVEGRLS